MTELEEYELMEEEMKGNPVALFWITLLGSVAVFYGWGVVLSLL